MIIGVAREMASTTIEPIPIPRFANLTVQLFGGNSSTYNGTPQWSEAIKNMVSVYPDFLGPSAFLIIFLIPFGMIYMSHGNMKLLGILGFLVGLFVLMYLPSNYVAAALFCVIISIVGFIYGLLRP
jgi:hypothetical protein